MYLDIVAGAVEFLPTFTTFLSKENPIDSKKTGMDQRLETGGGFPLAGRDEAVDAQIPIQPAGGFRGNDVHSSDVASTLSLDRSSQLPLYGQIRSQIEEAIKTGRLKPGHALPSEPELARSLGVSKMTVRHALNQLVGDGLITRQKGRGTFVAHQKVEITLPYFTSYSEDMARRGYTPFTQLLSVETVQASARQAKTLGLDERAPLIRIVRLRLADEIPIALETSWVNAALVPNFVERHRSFTSLYQVLQDDYDLRPTRARQSFEATSAAAHESIHLGIPAGSPILLLESVLYDQKDRPVDLTKAAYRGDRYKIYFERSSRL